MTEPEGKDGADPGTYTIINRRSRSGTGGEMQTLRRLILGELEADVERRMAEFDRQLQEVENRARIERIDLRTTVNAALERLGKLGESLQEAEELGRRVAAISASVDGLLASDSGRTAEQFALGERIAHLERGLAEQAEVGERVGNLERGLGEQSPLGDRLAQLERGLAQHSEVGDRLAQLERGLAQHSEVGDRLAHLERGLAELRTEHQAEAQAGQAALSAVREELAGARALDLDPIRLELTAAREEASVARSEAEALRRDIASVAEALRAKEHELGALRSQLRGLEDEVVGRLRVLEEAKMSSEDLSAMFLDLAGRFRSSRPMPTTPPTKASAPLFERPLQVPAADDPNVIEVTVDEVPAHQRLGTQDVIIEQPE